MPKINIYVPDELLDELRQHEDLQLSAIAQEAFRSALTSRRNAAWVARAASRRPRTQEPIDISSLMDSVREDFGA